METPKQVAMRRAGRAFPSPRESLPTRERPQPAEARFQTGDEVVHEVFGQGIVIESRLSGGDEQVTVAFAGVGLKRLMASMAPMERGKGPE